MSTKSPEAGYRLERVYVSSQSFRVVPADDKPEADDRTVRIGWDWLPIAPRRFEIIVEVTCAPTKRAPEEVNVRLAGVFEADEGVRSIGFPEFLRHNGPAILFPYAREVVSTMTGRGPHGAFHILPVNVMVLAEQFDISKTVGARYLTENADFAKSFGLDITPANRPPAAVNEAGKP